MGGRATAPGVSRIAVARSIMASRTCEGKLAVRQIMPWIIFELETVRTQRRWHLTRSQPPQERVPLANS